MNTVNLIGRLARDWDVKTTNGIMTSRNTIAVQRRLPNKQGQYESDFISIVGFNKTAELLEKHFRKGVLIGIHGRIRTGSYTNQNNEKVYTTDVIVEHFYFLEKKKVQDTQEDFDLFDVSDNDLPF